MKRECCPGYKGTDCDSPICHTRCGTGFICSSPDKCSPDPNYKPPTTTTKKPTPRLTTKSPTPRPTTKAPLRDQQRRPPLRDQQRGPLLKNQRQKPPLKDQQPWPLQKNQNLTTLLLNLRRTILLNLRQTVKHKNLKNQSQTKEERATIKNLQQLIVDYGFGLKQFICFDL